SRDKTTFEALAPTTKDFLSTIEKFTGTPVSVISNGAQQQATIMTRGELI
ncbi:adenylosuccinate synthetase, partial [bacterium]|nr:adenylosuccinate synthetase [bacterium]